MATGNGPAKRPASRLLVTNDMRMPLVASEVAIGEAQSRDRTAEAVAVRALQIKARERRRACVRGGRSH
jgi:hypothetical protein